MASKRSLQDRSPRDQDLAYGRPKDKRPKQDDDQTLEEDSGAEFEESQDSSQDMLQISTQTEREGCKSSGILVRRSSFLVQKSKPIIA